MYTLEIKVMNHGMKRLFWNRATVERRAYARAKPSPELALRRMQAGRTSQNHEEMKRVSTQNLSLRSLRTSLALRLALAITLLQASHAGLANLRIPGVESFELVCRNDCGKLDSGGFGYFALHHLSIVHGSGSVRISIGSTDEDRGLRGCNGVN